MLAPILLSIVANNSALAQSVDPLTGRLIMSVPIGTLQANDISIPIAVYHHGGSIRVAEGSGECGAGWNLGAGGWISRVVRGLPDEVNTSTAKGWLRSGNAAAVQAFEPEADDYLANCADEADDYDYIHNLVGTYVNDSEPDLYYINAPGLSAQFIWGPDGSPKLLVHQDITIELDTTTNSFQVTTNTGRTYTFGLGDHARGAIQRLPTMAHSTPADTATLSTQAKYFNTKALTFTTKWYLTSIYSNVTGTEASFRYSNGRMAGGRTYFNTDSTNFNTDLYFEYRLDTIRLKSLNATFHWSNGNDLLSQVTIEDLDSDDRSSAVLEYYPVRSGISYHHIKQFLKRLRIRSGLYSEEHLYDFGYQGVTSTVAPSPADWKHNWQMDYFGFENAGTGNKNLPQLYYAAGESDSRRLRTIAISGVSAATISGDARGVYDNASFGALTSITTPTGGTTTVTYEPNYYYDATVSSETAGPGVRVKKIVSNGGEAAYGGSISETDAYRSIGKEYFYTESNGTTTSGRLTAPVQLGYIVRDNVWQSVDQLGEEPQIMYGRVKEKILAVLGVTGKGYTIYEFNLPGVFPQTAVDEWKATKSLVARDAATLDLPCDSVRKLKNGYYLFPFAPSSNYSFKRGLSSRVAVYNQSDNLISEKKTTYVDKTSNASIVKGLRWERIRGIYYYGLYEILTGRVSYVSQEVVRQASQVDPTKYLRTTTNYAYKANLMLDSVTTSLPNSTTYVKKFKYAADYSFSSPTDPAAVAIKALNDNNRGSELIEEQTILTIPGSARTTLSASAVVFKDFGNGLVLPHITKALPEGSSFTPAYQSGQTIVYDDDYRNVQVMSEYDEEGRPLTTYTDRNDTAAYHYALSASYAVASFHNAAAQQCVFEGFEMPSTFGLAKGSGTGFEDASGWTGRKAIAFTNNSSSLISSPTNLVIKNGNTYRVSCWIYADSSKTITFNAKVGGTTQVSKTLINITDNKWNYLEETMDLSFITTPFQLEIITNAGSSSHVFVDDIVFMPQQARISLKTSQPLKGVTSSTDDHGNSVKYVYDDFGRMTYTLDRFRNVVLRNDYADKNVQNSAPVASIVPSTLEYFIDEEIQFAPYAELNPSGCTYAWEVDGSGETADENHSITKTFTAVGSHLVKLIVTNTQNISTVATYQVCVQYRYTGSVSYSVTNSLDQSANVSPLDCNSGVRHVTLNLPEIPDGCEFAITWTKDGEYYGSGSTIDVYGYAVSYGTTLYDDYVATIQLGCSKNKDCTNAVPPSYSGTVSFTVTITYAECQ